MLTGFTLLVVHLFTLAIKSDIMKSLFYWNINHGILHPLFEFGGYSLIRWLFERTSSELTHGRTHRQTTVADKYNTQRTKLALIPGWLPNSISGRRNCKLIFCLQTSLSEQVFLLMHHWDMEKIDFWREAKLEMLNNSDILSVDSQSLQARRMLERVVCINIYIYINIIQRIHICIFSKQTETHEKAGCLDYQTVGRVGAWIDEWKGYIWWTLKWSYTRLHRKM